MSKKSAYFRFSTNILARLGEELNPSASQGLIELVKNAYDADALICKIELIEVHDKSGQIIISDNGMGMDENEINNGWLILGKSRKISKKITPLGRIKTGDKGLGRLAALRLGKRVQLISIPKSETNIVNKLVIDWAKYDQANLVEEVELTIERNKNLSNDSSGTKIILEGLNSVLNRNEVKRLARQMILLSDPFGDNPQGFKPILISEEFKDLEKQVEAKYFRDAEFHLVAKVDKGGRAKAEVLDWKDDVVYEADHTEIGKKKRRTYNTPPLTFDLWVYILDKETFSSRSTTKQEVQEWLKVAGGVHFYYNGIRVSPYGDYGNDWLGLNLMRVRSPEVRPSTNTSVGRISVKDLEGRLVQKTDRSGFIENDEFEEIVAFGKDVLNWMAKKRLEERENKRIKERVESSKYTRDAKKELEDKLKLIPVQNQNLIKLAFDNYERKVEKEVNQLKKEVQLYRTLSTVGITSSVFAHESANNPIKLISQSIKTIKRRLENIAKNNYDSMFKNPVERVIEATKSLQVLSNVTLSLLDFEKRRASKIYLYESIENILKLYDPFIKSRDTQVETDFYPGNPFLRGSIAAIESIITNLLNNSLNIFEAFNTDLRLIKIRTNFYGEMLELRILDNGPGIQNISTTEIWLPGETTRKNGTGLGLTIVKDAVIDLGGEVDAIGKGELGGAEIIIRLPIIGL